MNTAKAITANLHEVWLLDTGHFLVLDQVHESWRSNVRWQQQMSYRTKLRFFVGSAELDNLPALDKTFEAARGYFEMAAIIAKSKTDEAAGVTARRFIKVLPTEADSAIKQVPKDIPWAEWYPPKKKEEDQKSTKKDERKSA